MGKYRAGVLFGKELETLYNDAKDNQFALPAVNVTGTNTINAVLESAAKVNSPVIIQFSNGGAQFFAGKGMPNGQLQANISGAISGALHIHNVAQHYGVPVVLHTDHAAKGAFDQVQLVLQYQIGRSEPGDRDVIPLRD
jgi:fructose-bisphosphate aldolase class II